MGEHRHEGVPSEFIREWLPRVAKGRALDVAMGEGRHALLMAASGFDVLGVDRDEAAISRARSAARAGGLTLDARLLDLEIAGLAPLAPGGHPAQLALALVVNVNYLQRDLFPSFIEALSPGGWILFETFTTDHPRVSRAGRPSNPDYLLCPSELKNAFSGLLIEAYSETVIPAGDGDRKAVARLAARRPEGVPVTTRLSGEKG
ncbi:MAG: methyltransferase domain-containing protein [Deltaproteobacteria bacterium]|nr:methyltransferase domain-containing protein [Deltaproteobacteria bacterium]